MSSEMLPIMTTVFGSAFGATANVTAGNEVDRLARYNASVAEANARAKDFEAEDAIQRGYLDETTHRKDVKRFIGSQRVVLAAQGQDLTSGTAADLQADSAREGEYDALTVRANAARESWGYKMESYNFRTQAEDLRQQGKIAKKKGRNAAAQTILTDATDILYRKFGKS